MPSAAEKLKVFYINSYHPDYPYSEQAEKRLLHTLQVIPTSKHSFNDSDSHVFFYRFAMDAKRTPRPEQLQKKAKRAMHLIDSIQPDLLLFTDDAAAEYVISPNLHRLKMPMLYAGINWDVKPFSFPANQIRGMVEIVRFKDLVDNLKILEKSERVCLLAAQCALSQRDAFYFKQATQSDCIDLVPSWDSWKTAFHEHQKRKDLLILGNTDPLEVPMDSMQNFVETHTLYPTASFNEYFAPLSLITVGKVRAEFGSWLGEQTLKIAHGTPITDIPNSENSHYVRILNMTLANKLGISFPPAYLNNSVMLGSDGAYYP